MSRFEEHITFEKRFYRRDEEIPIKMPVGWIYKKIKEKLCDGEKLVTKEC